MPVFPMLPRLTVFVIEHEVNKKEAIFCLFLFFAFPSTSFSLPQLGV